MKVVEHLKLAAFTGLLSGLVAGIIDIISRFFALNFQWFELYQTLFFSSIIFVLGFVFLGVLVELFIKLTKLSITRSGVSVFYALSAVMFLLLFYSELAVNNFLFPDTSWSNPVNFSISISLAVCFSTVYIILLIKGRRWFSNILSHVNIKKFSKNLIFLLVVFVLFSFFMDVWLLNHAPSFKSNLAPEDHPNVLFISMDTVRADHLSLYGHSAITSPNIDKLAEESVVFDNAVSQSSWTLPSHASMFTGKYPSSHNAVRGHQKLDASETTLAELLRNKGYNTAGFVGASYCQARYGIGQGFVTYKDRLDFFEDHHTFDKLSIRTFVDSFLLPIDKYLNADKERIAEETNQDIFAWLDKHADGPFFIFINYFDAHHPYNLGEEFREQFTTETMEYRLVRQAHGIHGPLRYANDFSEDFLDYMMALYDTEIYYLDYHINELFRKLDNLGVKENTIIIITADHGEEFNEHGGFGHGHTLYEENIHVPLIIYYPKMFQAQRISKRVEITGLFSTILDLLGVEVPPNRDSASILPLILDESSYAGGPAFSELFGRSKYSEADLKAVSSGSWKLIEAEPDHDLLPSSLFDLASDPGEQNNLYTEQVGQRAALHKYLTSITGSAQ